MLIRTDLQNYRDDVALMLLDFDWILGYLGGQGPLAGEKEPNLTLKLFINYDLAITVPRNYIL